MVGKKIKKKEKIAISEILLRKSLELNKVSDKDEYSQSNFEYTDFSDFSERLTTRTDFSDFSEDSSDDEGNKLVLPPPASPGTARKKNTVPLINFCISKIPYPSFSFANQISSHFIEFYLLNIKDLPLPSSPSTFYLPSTPSSFLSSSFPSLSSLLSFLPLCAILAFYFTSFPFFRFVPTILLAFFPFFSSHGVLFTRPFNCFTLPFLWFLMASQ